MTDLVEMAAVPETVGRKITSADIKLGLKHSFSSGYKTFFEVGNDTGARVKRHADAVAIGIWPSTGHQIHGFEVKVSRGDFLSEMKDPAKSQEVFRFCHRWSLATPPGLVKTEELPPNWGLVTFDGKILRTVKQAPLLEPERITYGFMAALVRRAGEEDSALIAAAVQKAEKDMRTDYEGRMEHRLREQRDRKLKEAEDAVQLVEQLKAALGEQWLFEIQVPEIAAAVKALRKSGIIGTYGNAIKIAEQLEASSKRIREAFASISETDEAVA